MAAARYQPLCPSHPLHRMQIFVYRRWLVDYHDRPPVRLVTCPAGVAVGDQADPGSMHVRGQRRGRVLAGQVRRRPAVPARPPWPALLLPAAARMVLCAAAPVRWIFARRLAGHSVARIARALNEAGVPCPSSADPGRNLHRTGAGWTLGTVTTILSNPRYTGRQVWNRQRTDRDLTDPADVSLGHKSVQRWNLPDGWVISRKPAHPALVSEADFIAAHDISAARSPAPGASPNAPRVRRYLLAGLPVCGGCGRRMESAWSNGKAAYRCRHGHTTASRRGPGRRNLRGARTSGEPIPSTTNATSPAAEPSTWPRSGSGSAIPPHDLQDTLQPPYVRNN